MIITQRHCWGCADTVLNRPSDRSGTRKVPGNQIPVTQDRTQRGAAGPSPGGLLTSETDDRLEPYQPAR